MEIELNSYEGNMVVDTGCVKGKKNSSSYLHRIDGSQALLAIRSIVSSIDMLMEASMARQSAVISCVAPALTMPPPLFTNTTTITLEAAAAEEEKTMATLSSATSATTSISADTLLGFYYKLNR